MIVIPDLGRNFWDIFAQIFLSFRVWVKPSKYVAFGPLYLEHVLTKDMFVQPLNYRRVTKTAELNRFSVRALVCFQRAFQNPSILVFETLTERPRRDHFVFGF